MKRVVFILSIAFLLVVSGCVHLARYDRSFRGKVVDAETREPLEDVVVLGIWLTETPTPYGATSEFYDAMETVTDENGEFMISGKGLRVVSNLEPVRVLVFKAGYKYIGPVDRDGLREAYYVSTMIQWEDDVPVFPLRRLTDEERKRATTTTIPGKDAPDDKMPRMIEEINKELKIRGLEPY
jgi:hypothetical protein